jgi:hypothetical protein
MKISLLLPLSNCSKATIFSLNLRFNCESSSNIFDQYIHTTMDQAEYSLGQQHYSQAGLTSPTLLHWEKPLKNEMILKWAGAIELCGIAPLWEEFRWESTSCGMNWCWNKFDKNWHPAGWVKEMIECWHPAGWVKEMIECWHPARWVKQMIERLDPTGRAKLRIDKLN